MFRSLFGRSTVERDLSFIGIDMHSHMLPGLDDGAATIEESISYFRNMKEWGFHTCILTPHILPGVHNNSPETILPVFERVKQELVWAGIELDIRVAAEYMVEEKFIDALMKEESLLCISEKKVLIEMSYVAPSPFIETAIFRLNVQGYKPILAHPERYGYYHHDFNQYYRLKEMGCIFQVNLLSLSGYYGPIVKKVALRMIKENLISYIGTDLHHHNHVDAIKAFTITKEFYEIMKGVSLLNSSL
jgi:protein-tyrosine phosphatase